MTQQEIENELRSLRALEEARKNNWRWIRKAAAFSALLFVLAGIGCVVFSIIHTSSEHAMAQTAAMFILLSAPMSLLGAALR